MSVRDQKRTMNLTARDYIVKMVKTCMDKPPCVNIWET